MAEPLSPNHVFDFSDDELELHLAYGFFAPGPLPGYANDPNNHNGWIDADVPLLRELGVVADGQMVSPVADEPIVDEEAAPRIDMDEDLAALFGDAAFDDDFDEVPPPSIYEAGGPSYAVAEGPSYPLSAPRLPVPPVVIEDLSTRLDNLEYWTSRVGKEGDLGVGLTGSGAAEGHTNSTVTEDGCRDEQPRVHVDAVYPWDG
nr:hypothetical protein [Tanacetum cinerariifolium]